MTFYNNTIKEVVDASQHIYDSFNEFIFSNDTRILAKLLARHMMLQKVIDVPGDIVELGVFKGSGMATFLKLKDITFPKITPIKVIGFDFFDTDSLVNSLSGNDKETMNSLFTDRNYRHTVGMKDTVENKLIRTGYDRRDFELIEGDINISVERFIRERPGFRARLVYIDVDLEEPTFNALEALWDKVSPGGVIVFDEVAISQWSESNGVDRFFKGKNLKLTSTNLPCPTAYIIKPNY
jgi:Macrocin-O-methyltransferase (TylF)